MLIGGGRNHRMGLFDMVMIKDNHISTAGGVKNALRCVDLYLAEKNVHMPVEVEFLIFVVFLPCIIGLGNIHQFRSMCQLDNEVLPVI